MRIGVIAIPTKAVADLPRARFANVPSSVVVIDIGNYHPELRDGRTLAEADRSRIVEYRAEQEARIRRSIGAGLRKLQ